MDLAIPVIVAARALLSAFVAFKIANIAPPAIKLRPGATYYLKEADPPPSSLEDRARALADALAASA